MESITHCPICNCNVFTPFLNCIDQSVSRETFHLVQCNACGLVVTNPRPGPKEIAAYYASPKYISHTNGTTSLFDRLYRIARSITLRQKLRLAADGIDRKTILDFGCGTGTFINYASDHGWLATGIEPSELARKQATQGKAEIKTSLSEIDGKEFSVITLWHVLEHVHDLNHTIKTLAGRLEPKGQLIIAVPNIESPDARRYMQHWAAYDTPRHLWHFSKSTMQRLLRNHDLTLTDIKGMPFDAYYVSMLSEQNKRLTSYQPTNYIMGAWNGLLSNLTSPAQNKSSLIYIATK